MSDLKAIFGGNGFDPTAVPEDEHNSYKPLPPGWYTAIVVNADVIATKAKDGQRLKIELDITDEAYANRKVFLGFNIDNPSAKAVEIGMRELASFSKACCGPIIVEDSAEFIDKVLMVKLVIKADPGRNPDNEVKGFKAVGGAVAAPPRRSPSGPAQTAKASAPAAPVAKAPVAKKATGGYPWETKPKAAPTPAPAAKADAGDDDALPF